MFGLPYVARSKPLMPDHMLHASFIKETGRWCSSHEQKVDKGIVSPESKTSLVTPALVKHAVNAEGEWQRSSSQRISLQVAILHVINRWHMLKYICTVAHKPVFPVHVIPKCPAVLCLLRYLSTQALQIYLTVLVNIYL